MRTFKNIISATILFLAPLPGLAQVAQPEVNVKDAEIRRDGDLLYVGFTAETGRFTGDYGVTLVPVVYDGAGNSAALEPLTLAGRRRDISGRRSGSVPAGRMLRSGSNSKYFYLSSAEWKPWMGLVNLSVYVFGEGCDGMFEGAALAAAEGRLVYRETETLPETKEPVRVPSIDDFAKDHPVLRPWNSYPERFAGIGGGMDGAPVRIFFRVGNSEIDPSYMGNSRTLELVADALRIIAEDPSATIAGVFIAGFASPEGGMERNTTLAQERAEAARDYMVREHGVKDASLFELYNGGEDWNGLRRMVAASDMPGRDKALYIIDDRMKGVGMGKDKLKNFENGVPYTYIRRHFFPELRSAGYIRIYYDRVSGADGQ